MGCSPSGMWSMAAQMSDLVLPMSMMTVPGQSCGPISFEHGYDGADRCGEDEQIGAEYARVQVVGGEIDGAAEERLQHGVGAAGNAAHLAAGVALNQVHAEAGAHQAQAHDGHATILQLLTHSHLIPVLSSARLQSRGIALRHGG